MIFISSDKRLSGRVTVPTDVDMIQETQEIVKRWGADAIRDCDGTDMPSELLNMPVKIYSTYYTTRKDNEWAKQNPDEVQQVYLMTKFYTSDGDTLTIPIMQHFYKEQLKPNTINDIKRWWEVVDRTIGEPLAPDSWTYDDEKLSVTILNAKPYHDYTVSFLAFIMWDPVHMYNFITNDWEEVEHQITYDVRQPKTKPYTLNKLKKWISENPDTDVIRFTTFFHQFTLVFNEYAKEKFVNWFGYSASVSPYILEQFEREVGYPFRPEYIIDQGYHNNTFRCPSKEFLDFMDFQQREVAKLMKEFIDICHESGKEAMMFLGDHWIGTEPFGKYFPQTGLDAVVGSVGNGTTLRLISDIPGVKYTEGRFLPYFFPDVFKEGGDPIKEAKVNWVTARRAMLRKPVDRIGYGGYLKLAMDFPDFIDYVESVCDEFRLLYENLGNAKPYCHFTVGVLNAWGRVRSWGTHMVAHAIDYKQTYSYSGILEALSGMPFEVKFISFDDVINDANVLNDCEVVINVGDAYTANSGGHYWQNEKLVTAVKKFVAEGGGFIGVGEPTACQHEGRYFTLANVLGVDKEISFGLSTNKYNWQENSHFITEDMTQEIDFGEGMSNVFALDNTTVITQRDLNVLLAANEFFSGRGVYIAGLPYSPENARLLYRAIFWAAGKDTKMKRWYSENINVEVHYYPTTNKCCIVNNVYEPQHTTVYDGEGKAHDFKLEANEILWYNAVPLRA